MQSTRQELKPELGDLIASLDDKNYQIRRIDDHYYFVYRDHVEEPRLLPIEDVKDQIYEHLKDIEFKKRFVQWLEQLKETAVIKHYAKP